MTIHKSILCLMTATALVGCGVKPGHVKSPSGSDNSYQLSYPAPSASQTAYDRDMAPILEKRAEAERAAKAAEEAAKNKPEWSIR